MRKQFAALAAASLILAAPSAAQASGFRSGPAHASGGGKSFAWTFTGNKGIDSRWFHANKGTVSVSSTVIDCRPGYLYKVVLRKKAWLGRGTAVGATAGSCQAMGAWHIGKAADYSIRITVLGAWRGGPINEIVGTTFYR